MAQEKDGNNFSAEESNQQPQTMQINVKMVEGERTGQPIFANISSVQPGQGILFIDFGFLDPQTMNALNQKVQSGENVQTVSARMSCRVAISPEAAHQLVRQLNSLLQNVKKAQVRKPDEQQSAPSAENHAFHNTTSNGESEVKESTEVKKGFRFPWSSSDKTH